MRISPVVHRAVATKTIIKIKKTTKTQKAIVWDARSAAKKNGIIFLIRQLIHHWSSPQTKIIMRFACETQTGFFFGENVFGRTSSRWAGGGYGRRAALHLIHIDGPGPSRFINDQVRLCVGIRRVSKTTERLWRIRCFWWIVISFYNAFFTLPMYTVRASLCRNTTRYLLRVYYTGGLVVVSVRPRARARRHEIS